MAGGDDDLDALVAISRDPTFRDAHEAMLPSPAPRRRGDIAPERAMAEAKLTDARSLDEAVAWLQTKERMVVLHDRALIDLLARLPA